jgi:recombinational DNA repair ATPase RecF
MKLVSVRVEHFRCIRTAKIEFAGGLNVLHGPNALGKSSLAHALRAALLLHTAAKAHDASANRSGSGACGRRLGPRVRLLSGPGMGSTLRPRFVDARWTSG